MEIISLVTLCILFATIFAAGFYAFSILVWTITIAIALVIVTVFSHFSLLILTLLWIPFLFAAAFANLHSLRRQWIIKPAIARLQRQMPSISSTERDAIEAGDTWWEKELFCGKPDWNQLIQIPKPTLSQAEQAFLDNQVETLCEMVNDWEIVYQDHNLSQEVWDYLKREKFFAMVIPKEYGGLGFSALAHSTVVTKIASRSISAAVTTMVPNSLGPGELLVRYGTKEQRDFYLPKLASGTEIPCFALTAPDAGSDAGAIPDSGVICKGMHEGQEIIGIKLNWDKRYITLAPVATLLGIAAHLYDPDHLLGDKVTIGITLCLIPSHHPGVENGNRHLPMYSAFMNGPTRGKDVFIPLDWIIGGAEMAGKGWRMLMESLSIGRSISLPALSTACGKLVCRTTGAYSRIRRQFNTPIANFEGVEEALGYIGGYTYLLNACRVMTAGAIDQDINPAIVSAIAKYHMTEMARTVVSHGMDVHAGQMIQAGPRNILANVYVTVPISVTVEGANILTRNLIIFGQGAIRCHPYLLREVELITAPTPNVTALDQTILGHMGFFIGNFLKSFAYGMTGGWFIFSGPKVLRPYTRQLTRMSSALAMLADCSLILLGGSLKRRERLSARLGDMMSNLYLASTAIKYYHDHNTPDSDKIYVQWCIDSCLYKIQIAIIELCDNFPNKIVGKLLKFIVFPWGNSYKVPEDKLHKKIVETLVSPSEFRSRILSYTYLSKDPTALDNRLEKALSKVDEVEPILKKLSKYINKSLPHSLDAFEARIRAGIAAKIISADEEKLLREFETLRKEIVKVNEFSFDLNEILS